ncbi:MAG TPA: glycosyltransferase [Bacteroidota bacterium]|nr:glycosyltransferase [Bacteroidota bacterium]
MKKVLIITYYFPPSGGPGVQRVLKFAKYLPQFGWEPVVLTVKDGDYPARDESLLKEIPSSLKVYRTSILEPYNFYRKITGKRPGTAVDVDNIPKKGEKKKLSELVAEFVRATFFIPDARAGWLLNAAREAKKIIEKEQIEAIYSSSPPYTCAVIARNVHRSSGIPWIAGFRDPWTGFLSTPERWSLPRKLDAYLERSCFEEATRVEVAWRGILFDLKKKYPEIPADKVAHLPNGFDSADFPAVVYKKNEKFTVTYTGSMYGVRNPRTFLQAVSNLLRANRIDPSKIRLKFIGRFGGEIVEMFREPTVAPIIETIPYLPHNESIAHLMTSDALLLIVDEYAGGEEIVPGKVFEYIGAGRPIMAIAHEGAVAELLRSTRTGLVASNDDVPAIERVFLEYYTDYLYNKSAYSPNPTTIAQFERKEITRKLAQLLNEAVERKSS